MALPSIFNSMNTALKEIQTDEILQSNRVSQKYGLVLTTEEANEIIEARDHILQSYGRIELDSGITTKLIASFCSSSFIAQEDYASTLKELHEIFYYMKNETEDEIGDDGLIETIKDFFDNFCKGSMELLKGRELEAYARNCRKERMSYGSYNCSESSID